MGCCLSSPKLKKHKKVQQWCPNCPHILHDAPCKGRSIVQKNQNRICSGCHHYTHLSGKCSSSVEIYIGEETIYESRVLLDRRGVQLISSHVEPRYEKSPCYCQEDSLIRQEIGCPCIEISKNCDLSMYTLEWSRCFGRNVKKQYYLTPQEANQLQQKVRTKKQAEQFLLTSWKKENNFRQFIPREKSKNPWVWDYKKEQYIRAQKE